MDNMTNVGAMFSRTGELIEWLTEKGIATASLSRAAKYRELGSVFFADKEPVSPEAAELFAQLTKSIYEFRVLLLVKDMFEDENSPGFLERLANAHKGKPFVYEAKDGASRNFLFELCVAVFFAKRGYKIEFSEAADIIAYRDNFKIYIECKKCYSSKKIEENLKYAHKQLIVNTTPHDSNIVGLVALDISHLSDEYIPKCDFPNSDVAQSAVKYGIAQAMNNISRKIYELNARFIDTTLATLVYSDNMFWLENISVFLHQDCQVIAAKKLNDTEFAKLSGIVC